MTSRKSIIGLAIMLGVSSTVHADTAGPTNDIKQLQRSIVNLQQKIEPTLFRKAHIILRDQNFKMEGHIQGNVSGSMVQTNRMSSGLAGALVGGLTGGVIGLTTSLGGPTGLFLMGAAGGFLGALNPEKTGQGQITGQLEGRSSGEGWDNHYDPKNFIVFVIDPSQQNLSPYLSQHGFKNDECAQNYTDLLKAIVQSRRFFTPNEVHDLVSDLTDFQRQLYQLDRMRVEASDSTQTSIQKFLEEKSSWLNKKMTIVNIGHEYQIQPLVMQTYDYGLLRSLNHQPMGPIKVAGNLSRNAALDAVELHIFTNRRKLAYPSEDRSSVSSAEMNIDKTTKELVRKNTFSDRFDKRFPLLKEDVIRSMKLKNSEGLVCSSLKDFLPSISNQVEILIRGMDVDSYEMQLALKRTQPSIIKDVLFEE